MAISQREGFELERQRHVDAAPAGGDEAGHAGGEAIERREDRLVAHVLRGLAGERRVYARRFAVRDRIADDGVTVGHADESFNPCRQRSQASRCW